MAAAGAERPFVVVAEPTGRLPLEGATASGIRPEHRSEAAGHDVAPL